MELGAVSFNMAGLNECKYKERSTKLKQNAYRTKTAYFRNYLRLNEMYNKQQLKNALTVTTKMNIFGQTIHGSNFRLTCIYV